MQDVLKDLVGCCDNQQGSRHVQELLIRATPEEVSPAFDLPICWELLWIALWQPGNGITSAR